MRGTEWPSGLSRRRRHFSSCQVTVSWEQMPPSPHPGNGRNLRVHPIGNSARTQHTRVPTYPIQNLRSPSQTRWWPNAAVGYQKKNLYNLHKSGGIVVSVFSKQFPTGKCRRPIFRYFISSDFYENPLLQPDGLDNNIHSSATWRAWVGS